MNNIKIAVVIAAYNEDANIKELTFRIDNVMKANNINYELIYVIAGTDRTIGIVRELEKKFPITYFYTKKPEGLGNAFKKGFAAVSQDAGYVLTMDADLNHQPEEIPLFVREMQKNNPDIIIGSRYIKNAARINVAWWKLLVSKFANIIFNMLTRVHVKDKTSGYRLYKSEVIKKIYPLVISRNFEFLLEMLLIAAARKYTLKEIPITFIYRIHGKSKMNLQKTACGYAKLLAFCLMGKYARK